MGANSVRLVAVTGRCPGSGGKERNLHWNWPDSCTVRKRCRVSVWQCGPWFREVCEALKIPPGRLPEQQRCALKQGMTLDP